MPKKIYLHLLFFCGILCQGIFASLSDNYTSLSSNSLVRNRRVIDHSPGGQHETVNYIVRIRIGQRVICSGAILSHRTVIAAAACIQVCARVYKVLSGGAYDDHWNLHNVTSEIEYYENLPYQAIDGISLITVDPPFVYNRNTGYIQLHAGPLPTGTMITVFGWERVHPDGPGVELRHRMRTITIPIMNHRECLNLYRNRFIISEKHICTICTVQYCARGETGGPLVINNRLAGIHTLKGPFPGQINPDIFVNLQLAGYNQWIREHTR